MSPAELLAYLQARLDPATAEGAVFLAPERVLTPEQQSAAALAAALTKRGRFDNPVPVPCSEALPPCF